MVDVDRGGRLTSPIERVKELEELARDFVERPGDPATAARLKALPLGRESWEGLGDEAAEALTEITPLVSYAMRSLDRTEDAVAWYHAALGPCERAALACEERSLRRSETLARLIQILSGMAGCRINSPTPDGDTLAEAGLYLERATKIAEELVAEDARYIELLAWCWFLLGYHRVRSERCEESTSFFERALPGLALTIERRETPGWLFGDPRARVIECLARLEQTDQALDLFDRAVEEARHDREGRFDAKAFAGVAIRVAVLWSERDHSANTADWSERAASLLERLPDGSPDDRLSLATFHSLAGLSRMEAVEERDEEFRSQGERIEPTPAGMDVALASCRRAVELVLSLDDVNLDEDTRQTFTNAALNIGIMQTKAGRVEEALEAFERADSLMQRLGVTREVVNWSTLVREGKFRSEALRSLGRHAEAVPWLEQTLRASEQVEEETDDFEELRTYLSSELLDIADQTGTEVRLEPARVVKGSEFLAFSRYGSDRNAEAARWIERSEAARKEASLPAGADQRRLADTAYWVGFSLNQQGMRGEAISVLSRAASICEELIEIGIDAQSRLGEALYLLAIYEFERVQGSMGEALGAEAPDHDVASALVAKLIRLALRSSEALEAALHESPEVVRTWTINQDMMALCHRVAGRSEAALECLDRIIQLHEQGRAVLDPSRLAEAWMGRAGDLRRLGRPAEAQESLERALNLAKESGDAALIDEIRGLLADSGA